MFHLKKSEVQPLTPDLARQFSEMPPCKAERPLKGKRVKMLHEKARSGWLVPFDWASAWLGSDRYRINGQHSSKMLCELNGQFPEGLYVHLDEYTCDSEDDVGLLYRQLDESDSARGEGDIAQSYQGLEPALAEVPDWIARLACKAIAWQLDEIQGLAVPRRKGLFVLMHDEKYHPFIRWLGKLLGPKKAHELKEKTVVGAIYATYCANQEEAIQFWGEVSHEGIQHEEDHPTGRLDNWLNTYQLTKPTTAPVHRLKPGDLYNGCIYAWNCYRDGKDIGKDIRYSSKTYMQAKP